MRKSLLHEQHIDHNEIKTKNEIQLFPALQTF